MRLLLNNNIFYFYRMQPLNPASLDNNGLDNINNINNNNNNNNRNRDKRNFNKTVKNQKPLYTNESNESNDSNQSNVSSKNATLAKITGVDDVMKSIFNQNNESINSSINSTGTIFDITNNQNVDTESLKTVSRAVERPLLQNSTNNGEIMPSNQDDNMSAKPLSDNLTILMNPNNPNNPNNPDNPNNLNNNQNNIVTSRNDELLQKLNYMIYLLEEQRAQKSNYVTEEIILYIFLGIFIIFILDKFRQPVKYTR